MQSDPDPASVTHSGREVIAAYVKTLPDTPGVYRMLDATQQVLYVGKAKSLRKRVASYTRLQQLPERLQYMVNATHSMVFLTTRSETEALLLESNLIKRFLPRYNVLLRDDKSYPYLAIEKSHPFPEVNKTRRPDRQDAELFGPFATMQAVEQTLVALQKAFLLRSCSDVFFNNRKRPCLQYFIKRCSAPCVGYIEAPDYKESLEAARQVLAGKSAAVQQQLSDKMQAASASQDYERALLYRNQIQALAKIQAEQSVYTSGLEAADVVAVAAQDGQCCVEVVLYRHYRHYGNQSLFPKHDKGLSPAEVLSAFLPLFYVAHPPPREILVNMLLPDQSLIESALSQAAGHTVHIRVPQRGEKYQVIAHAQQNATDAVRRKMAEGATIRALHEALAVHFEMNATPQRIEVYDNSHTQGTLAVGAMIVAGPEGFLKTAYRKFNIKSDITPGDDYGMMREVIKRRFRNHESPDFTAPDLMLIDGGAGQLHAVLEALESVGVSGMTVVGIAKGKARIPGEERFFMPGRAPFRLPATDPGFYYIQRLRDEAHRFAITAHRGKRANALKKSTIDDIPNIGGKRKHLLLRHFGSARGVAEASVVDLEKVPGISKALAQTIFEFLHN